MGFSHTKNIPKVVSPSSGTNNASVSKNVTTNIECCSTVMQDCCSSFNNNNDIINTSNELRQQKQVGTYLRIIGDMLNLSSETRMRRNGRESTENRGNGG